MVRTLSVVICLLVGFQQQKVVECKSSGGFFRFGHIGGRRYEVDDSSDDEPQGFIGSGREFNILGGNRGGNNDETSSQQRRARKASTNSEKIGETKTTSSRQRLYGATTTNNNNSLPTSNNGANQSNLFKNVQTWWSTTLPNLPRLNLRIEPITKLKLRKTFRPLGTIVKLGAEYNPALGVWQFKSSWEDAIIGGKLTLAGKELQLTKSWQVSMGPVDDFVTRLRLRAAFDMQAMKGYLRVGVRSERLSPLNIVEGFTVWRRIPLNGPNGPLKLEVQANVALPEPEIEISSENQNFLVGMGDIELNLEELNLLYDF